MKERTFSVRVYWRLSRASHLLNKEVSEDGHAFNVNKRHVYFARKAIGDFKDI